MMRLHEVLHSALQATAGAWLNQFYVATIFAVVILLFCRFAVRVSARTRFAMICLALSMFAIPPGVIGFLSRTLQLFFGAPAKLSIVLTMSAPLVSGGMRGVASSELLCAAFTCSSFISVALMIWTGRAYLSSVHRFRRERTNVSERLVTIVESCARARAVNFPVWQSNTDTPTVVGFFRPSLLLPPYVEDLSDEEICALVAHEVEHIIRRDNLVALAATTLSAIFWFNPVFWIATWQLRSLRESACDEAVLRRGFSEETYCSALLGACRAAVAPQPHLAACAAGSNMKERMEYMSNISSLVDRGWRSAVVVAATLLLGATALTFPAVAAQVAERIEPRPDDFEIEILEVKPDTVKMQIRIFVTENGSRTVISAPTITTHYGQAAEVSSAFTDANGVEWRSEIKVTPMPNGSVESSYKIKRNGAAHQQGSRSSTLEALQKKAETIATPSEPIDLTLKESDFRRVLATFAELTGHSITADVTLEGKITISLDDVPWRDALDQVAAQVNARVIYVPEDKAIRIEPR